MSYGMTFVKFLEKNDHIVLAPLCIVSFHWLRLWAHDMKQQKQHLLLLAEILITWYGTINVSNCLIGWDFTHMQWDNTCKYRPQVRQICDSVIHLTVGICWSQKQHHTINSLWTSDSIWRHRSGSTWAQVMDSAGYCMMIHSIIMINIKMH